MCRIWWPSIDSTGRARSNAARGPPAKIEMLPDAARWQPPDTGQSSAVAPCAATLAASRLISAASVVLISSQTLPGAEALEQAVRTFDDRGGDSRRGQAGDDEVAGLGHRARRVRALRALRDEVGDGGLAEVADHEVDAVTQQVAGQRRAEVAEPDDADPEFRLVRAMHLAIVPEFQYKT